QSLSFTYMRSLALAPPLPTRRSSDLYASLAGSHIAHVNTETGEATVIEPPTPNQGARRVWSDSQGRIWVSEWNAGQLGMYDPARSEEHTSELQSREKLVCRLLL